MARRTQLNTHPISCPSVIWATRSAPMEHLVFEPDTQKQSAVTKLFKLREETDL